MGCFSNWNSDRNFLRIPGEFCSHLFANKKKLIFVSRQYIIKFLSEKRDGRGIVPEFSVGKLKAIETGMILLMMDIKKITFLYFFKDL